MKTPIKRPVNLRRDYLYLLDDGNKMIFLAFGRKTGKAIFRFPRREKQYYVPYWKRSIVKRIRKKTENE